MKNIMNTKSKNLSLLLLALFLSSCFSKNVKVKSSENVANTISKSSSITPDLKEWNNSQKINLLNHQLIPIDYLENNPDVKGLIVSHEMGTGKTFLAIGLAERHPTKEVILMVPRFLTSHWKKNLTAYGVKNRDRYKIISLSSPEELLNTDLSNTIVIIDESHKLINNINSPDPATSDLYSKLYIKLRSSYKILSLTGTPMYNNIYDIVLQMNLVSGKDLLPFNIFDFRKNYTTINQEYAFARGHWAESQIVPIGLSMTTLSTAQIIGASPLVFLMATATATLTPYFIKSKVRIDDWSFRSLNAQELDHIISKYTTYYNVNNVDMADYPAKYINYQNVHYNDQQLSFFLRLADNQLKAEEVWLLQQDATNRFSSEYIALNSSTIQNNLKSIPGNGRQIGNLIFSSAKHNKVIYPDKFKQALKVMNLSKGPVMIYSHYYHNGILLFAQYLDAMGRNGEYVILDPNLPEDKYENIISRYNDGKIKFLLVHPEIMEGISLKRTSQLHMLEPSFNQATQDQVIARAVRYKSHADLPLKDRKVDVYIWKQSISSLDLRHALALRRNWHKNFSELNYYTERLVIDKNTNHKLISPDDLAYKSMTTLNTSLKELLQFFNKHSIEFKYNRP